jgi:hypothetical protein
MLSSATFESYRVYILCMCLTTQKIVAGAHPVDQNDVHLRFRQKKRARMLAIGEQPCTPLNHRRRITHFDTRSERFR